MLSVEIQIAAASDRRRVVVICRICRAMMINGSFEYHSGKNVLMAQVSISKVDVCVCELVMDVSKGLTLIWLGGLLHGSLNCKKKKTKLFCNS